MKIRTCDAFETDNDVKNFFALIADSFAGEVQYNNLVIILFLFKF